MESGVQKGQWRFIISDTAMDAPGYLFYISIVPSFMRHGSYCTVAGWTHLPSYDCGQESKLESTIIHEQ